MLYRKFGKCGFETSILGFGCMRLPLMGGKPSDIDEAEAVRMIRHAIDSGVNYIDTAYPYHGGASEPLVAKALGDGYRQKVRLATKLPSWLVKERPDMERYLNEQLQRLKTESIDLYLLHSLDKSTWEKLVGLGVFEVMDGFRKSGKIKYMGFSFHDDAKTFMKICDSYDWDFCQIQFNYMDEQEQAGIEGLKHAAAKGLGVVIMEPLRGGKLANQPPEKIRRIWDEAEVKRSPADWGLRWVWNHPEVSVVLSGMSTYEQVEQNLSAAESGFPDSLTGEELRLIGRVRDAFRSGSKVGCTGCGYCMPCPFGVNIPRNFSIYNEAYAYNAFEEKKKKYRGEFEKKEWASNCRRCGKCEKACPQKIPVRECLKQVAGLFEADSAEKADCLK